MLVLVSGVDCVGVHYLVAWERIVSLFNSTSLDGILTSDTCEAALLGTGMGMEKVGQLGHIWYVCCLITKSSLDAAITEELAPGLGTCLKQSMKYLLMTTHV